MKTKLRKNFGFGKLLLTLLFSFLMLVILLYGLSRGMKAEFRAPSLKASNERSRPGLLDYQTGVSTCEQTENLVSNPGFEQGIGCHNQWCCGDCGGICTCEEYYPGHSSNIAAWIFAGYTRTESCALFTPSTDMIPVESGRSYDYSAWIKADLLQGSAYLRITFWSPDWEWKGEARTTSVTGTRDWVKVTGSVQVPTDAEYARVECTVSDLGKGSVWFDDIFLGLATCLDISKSDNPDPVAPGQMLTYTIVYSNTGREKATDVWIVDTFDDYVVFDHADPGPWSGTKNTWRFAEVLTKTAGTITVVVKVAENTDERASLVNYVHITFDELDEEDPYKSPIYVTETTVISPADGCALKLILPDPDKSVEPDQTALYELLVNNVGHYTGTVTVLTSSVQGWDVLIEPPVPFSLPAEGSRTVKVSPAVPQCKLSGTVDVTLITTTLSCEPPCSKTVTETKRVATTVTRQVGVDIEPDTSKPPPASGTTVTFTHTVTNTGNWTDTLTLSGDFPDDVTVTIEPSQLENLGPCESQPIAVTVGDLESDTELTGTIRAACMSDPTRYDEVIDRLKLQRLYLPLVAKCYCPPFCNGDFETSNFTCWTHGGELDQSVQSEIAYEGDYAALLGNPNYPCKKGVLLGEAWIKQTFSVPSCPKPELSFKYRIFSNDRLSDDKWDSFDVYINDTLILRDGNTDWNQASCDREPWDSGWKDFSYDLSAYKGQCIQVSFHNVSRADHWYNTWTYVDPIEVACKP